MGFSILSLRELMLCRDETWCQTLDGRAEDEKSRIPLARGTDPIVQAARRPPSQPDLLRLSLEDTTPMSCLSSRGHIAAQGNHRFVEEGLVDRRMGGIDAAPSSESTREFGGF